MKKIIILVSFFISFYSYSQIAIGNKTFDPHAQLDVTGTQKGVLIPRVKLKDLKSPDPFDTNIDPLPESLLVYNTGEDSAVDPGYYYWSNEQWNKLVIKDELGEVIPDGKDLSSKELSISPDGKGAVLKEIALSIKDTVISAEMLKDQAVIPVKIEPGIAGQILTTKKDNTVAWKAPAPLDIPSKDLTSDHLEITNDGKEAVLRNTKLTIKKNIISADMLQDQAVIPVKIKPGTANQILTTNEKGEGVVWTDLSKLEGKKLSSDHLTIAGGDKAVLNDTKLSISNDVITEAMLKKKAVTPLKIEPSKNVNQILTTNNKKEVVWADLGSTNIINKLVSEGIGENILKSTVNGVDAITDIVKTVVVASDEEGNGNKINVTVNKVNDKAGGTKIVKEVVNTLGNPNEKGYPLMTTVNGVSAKKTINIPEPWHTTGDIKASLNNQDIHQMGKVGIGESNPKAQLDVKGSVRLQNTEILSTPEYIVTMDANQEIKKTKVADLIKPGPGEPDSSKWDYTPKGGENPIPIESAIFREGAIRIGKGDKKEDPEPGALLDVRGDAVINGIMVGQGKGEYIDGEGNIVLGKKALEMNMSGSKNVVIGSRNIPNNKTGSDNIAIGYDNFKNLSVNIRNLAIGNNNFKSLKDGNMNITIGYDNVNELIYGTNNILIGSNLMINEKKFEGARNNTIIGNDAKIFRLGDDLLSNSTAIGYQAVAKGGNTIRLGNDKITKIEGQVPWSNPSDQRWKKDIETIPLGLDFINKVRPVEYIRKNNDDQTKEWGVIAQELKGTLEDIGYEKAGIVQDDGSPDKYLSVRYTDLIAPVIKAIQELAKENQELKKEIEQLKSKN